MLKQATVFYFGMNYGRAKKEKEKKKKMQRHNRIGNVYTPHDPRY